MSSVKVIETDELSDSLGHEYSGERLRLVNELMGDSESLSVGRRI